MLILDRDFLMENENKIDKLKESLEFGHALIKENGICVTDYKVHPFNKNKIWRRMNTRKYQLRERQKERFISLL